MILRRKIHDFELQLLSSVILSGSKLNVEIDLPQWITWLFGRDVVEACVGVKFAKDMFIFLNVSAYIRFRLLPPSMNTRGTLNPAITAGKISADCPGRGTCCGWSAIVKPMSCPDQLRYSIIGGGIFSAMNTYREITFCALLDGLPF